MKRTQTLLKTLCVFIFLLLAACTGRNKPEDKLHRIVTGSPAELKELFSYSPDGIPFVCAHRGGDRKGFPENCIATFNNTLSQTWSLIETDPRYTKDSVMVLMHDPTLERTTNGTGKVSDHTWAELQELRLKDNEGNLTGYQIPTLDEALEWARGKTILVLDRKDVPIGERSRKIQEHRAQSYAIVIAYSPEEIKQCFSLDPDINMEIMLADTAAVRSFEETGVPWKNVVGFVSHKLVEDTAIFDLIHNNGALAIVGSSRNHDISFKNGEIKSTEELFPRYVKMITDGADIIEADLAVEAGISLREMQITLKMGPKGKFFTGL